MEISTISNGNFVRKLKIWLLKMDIFTKNRNFSNQNWNFGQNRDLAGVSEKSNLDKFSKFWPLKFENLNFGNRFWTIFSKIDFLFQCEIERISCRFFETWFLTVLIKSYFFRKNWIEKLTTKKLSRKNFRTKILVSKSISEIVVFKNSSQIRFLKFDFMVDFFEIRLTPPHISSVSSCCGPARARPYSSDCKIFILQLLIPDFSKNSLDSKIPFRQRGELGK